MSIVSIQGSGPVTPPVYTATTGQAAGGSLPHNGTAYYMPISIADTARYALCVYSMEYGVAGWNHYGAVYFG